MLYLFVDQNQIKLLFLKKTLLGQYESFFYEKRHQIDLINNGQITNTDFFASALKEAVTLVSPLAVKEKEVELILPQEAFQFLRADIPPDIALTAVSSFIRDKARAQLSIDIDNAYYDYLIQESEKGNQVLFFALDKDKLSKYNDALALLNFHVTNIIPQVLAYFKLFEKTLRKDKKEYIIYADYEKEHVSGYLFDTYGPLTEEKIINSPINDRKTIEEVLKLTGEQYEAEGKKINRLILSGTDSENIRQDTFTKDIGIWTNPLKKIIPQFYQDYLKILVTPQNQPLPYLQYDVNIGAFIFSLENKGFSFFKKKAGAAPPSKQPGRKVNLPIKGFLIFAGSFILSFIVLMLILKANVPGMLAGKNIPLLAKAPTATPMPTPTDTPTPTPAISRKDIKVKILNGSGTKGQATTIKNELKSKGYTEILTDNADNFDYTQTEIQIKKGPNSNDVKALITSDLKENVSDPKITELDSKEASDVIIIFGKDFK